MRSAEPTERSYMYFSPAPEEPTKIRFPAETKASIRQDDVISVFLLVLYFWPAMIDFKLEPGLAKATLECFINLKDRGIFVSIPKRRRLDVWSLTAPWP